VKNAYIIIGLVLFGIVACTSNANKATTQAQVLTPVPASKVTVNQVVTKDDLANLEKRVEHLGEQLSLIHEYNEGDYRFLLFIMDHDLDAAERGEEGFGSFTDCFVPNLADAMKLGAPRKDVEARINRMINLAKKSVYLSSYEADLAKAGGVKAIRSYVKGNAGI
jgi:hypothetical protein